MNARSLFDAIDFAFGRHRQTSDYVLNEGDMVSVGDVTYVVRVLDFVDPNQATAAELAMCLYTAGADVKVVSHDSVDGLKRVEPHVRIRRARST